MSSNELRTKGKRKVSISVSHSESSKSLTGSFLHGSLQSFINLTIIYSEPTWPDAEVIHDWSEPTKPWWAFIFSGFFFILKMFFNITFSFRYTA